MIRQVSLSVYVIIHCDVLIIIRLLVFIIGKLCSRLSRVDSKVPKKTQDAEYDGWSLVEGEPRPEFGVGLFLQRHKEAKRHIDRLSLRSR